MRFMGLCLLFFWMGAAQAADIGDTRFQVDLNFEDTGVAPSIPDQVQQALPQLWQRIVPQSEQATWHNLQAMLLLKSIHPHGLSSTIIFNKQRVWQELKARKIPYIHSLPRFYITLDILDTLGRHNTPMEVELNTYINQISQQWGIQRNKSGTLLALHVQWLNDRQFYISVLQQGHDSQGDQQHSVQDNHAIQALQTSLLNTLLRVRNQSLVQTTIQQAQIPEEQAVETLSFVLHIQGQTSLSHQILLENALQSDSRVISITPTHIEGKNQSYQVVVNQAPELWLESWFFQRGMTATLGLEGWLAE